MVRKNKHTSSTTVLKSFLIFLFLVTSTGFSLETHFSEDNYYSFAVNGEADSCCQTECECCSEQNITVKINDDYEYTVPVEINTITFITELPFVNFNNQFISTNTSRSNFLIRPPPLIERTSTSFLQIFRC
jgi:hypothetical protein